jgi:predicted metalloprotease with PDZ domain
MKTLLCLAFTSLAFTALPLLGQEPVRYAVSFPNAAHHEAEVRATFSGIRQPVLEVLVSRSSPGRYTLHEFPKNVYNFKATDGHGHALAVTQPFDYQWNIAGHKGTVVVEYTVFGDRTDGTFDGIDTTHAHLNMPATFAYAHGFEKSPVTLQFAIPDGSGWKIATQLAPHPDGTWTAPNMDRMMDSPVEISNLTMVEWKTGESQFRMALHHNGTAEEAAAYAKLIAAVTAEEEGVWGAFPQYDTGTYTFLLDYLPYASDGMEHRNSTVIGGTRDLRDAASQLIGTVAHEFFHSWNVKRIRPKSLEPFDFENPNMSGELWFAEGFTNYYGPLALKRAGLQSIERFTRSMGGAVSTVMTAPGRQIFNVVDMSRHAVFFDGAASNDPVNTANIFISYYTYGQAIALGTDLAIRAQFPGKSLDDWMRAMWREHPDTQKPYTLDDLQQTLASVTSREFAAQIFTNHVYGKEPMDYEKLLAHAGILLRKASTPKVWTGVQAQGLTFSDRGADITASTPRGSPLYDAGLDRGDRIVEWDGKAIKTQADLTTLLDAHKPGDHIKLQVETRGGKKEAELELAGPPGYEMEPYEMVGKELSPEMKAFRDAWLSSKAIHPAPAPVKYCNVCKRSLAFEYTNCPFDGTALSFIPGGPAESVAPAGGRGAGGGGRGGRGGGGQ